MTALMMYSKRIDPFATTPSVADNVSIPSLHLHSAEANTTSHSGDMDISPTFSPSVEVLFICMYTLTTFLGLTGNLLAIIIFSVGKRSKTDLRPFLMNLSVSDLIMTIFCIPFTFTLVITENWVFSAPMCPIVSFLQVTSVTASVFTNMAIGIDRFIAVTYPLRSRVITSKFRVVILVIWICAISIAAVQFKISHVILIGNSTSGEEMWDCGENWPNEEMRRGYTFFMLICTYVIPLCILIVTYSIVAYILHQRIIPGVMDDTRDQIQLKSTKKIVKMLITVVFLFGLCWLPIHTFMLVHDFNPSLYRQQAFTMRIIFTCVHWLSMSNSFVNPVIYCAMNDSFKADVKMLLSKCFPCFNWHHPISHHITRRWKSEGPVVRTEKKAWYSRRKPTAKKTHSLPQFTSSNGVYLYTDIPPSSYS